MTATDVEALPVTIAVAIDHSGHDQPDHVDLADTAHAWLGRLGPTATALIHVLIDEHDHDTPRVTVDRLAWRCGVGVDLLARTVARLQRFHVIDRPLHDAIIVNRYMPAPTRHPADR